MEDACKYGELTTRFKTTLKLTDEMFDSNHDLCFCLECHNKRQDKDTYTRGNPSYSYVLPKGYRRFGICIKEPNGTTANHVFKNWHMAFHGTSVGSVESIWRVGLRMAGEKMWNGKDLIEKLGHFNDKMKPKGFDTKQIFLSPSIRYAGDDIYAPPIKFNDSQTKWTYDGKVAFQLRIRPDSYKIGENTTARDNIDPHISDSVLEWSTKDKSAIMLTGLLVKVTQ